MVDDEEREEGLGAGSWNRYPCLGQRKRRKILQERKAMGNSQIDCRGHDQTKSTSRRSLLHTVRDEKRPGTWGETSFRSKIGVGQEERHGLKRAEPSRRERRNRQGLKSLGRPRYENQNKKEKKKTQDDTKKCCNHTNGGTEKGRNEERGTRQEAGGRRWAAFQMDITSGGLQPAINREDLTVDSFGKGR